ncbi:FkbM family methyltransferase [Ruegeria sp. 2205SS24-7]|uniref:FkbM family methyltransferase n=1 Tax=Ruegeria discodermiae TaxID=3064389 RepID=UPI0027410F9D|nr:FkbM family methyltransferase [Ruegeria sp. 2205SS24-7]MDP5218184.1 FkbM family methyltransferase [Ruegeria sp. 2205SS24-7]
MGEDASFDVALAKKYGARILLVDPTPRAVSHYEAMKSRFGRSAEIEFVEGGTQPVEAYDLDGISASDLVLEPTALWTENTTLKFFQPENPEHVSHSIVNFQNNYRKDTAAIEVEAITLQTLLHRHGLEGQPIALLKLDIEGAEVEVLEQLAEQGVFPRQICVEFDELNRPGDKAFERVDRADAALRSAGYQCVYGNGGTDYLYLKR